MTRIRLLQTLRKHKGIVWSVAWHPKGDIFVSCGQDRHIRVWGPEANGNYVVKMLKSDAHTQTIREISWSPSGNCLATASFDKMVLIWTKNGTEYESTATLEVHDNEVKSVAFSNQDPVFLATCGRDKTVAVWKYVDVDDFEFCASLEPHRQDVKRVKFNPFSEESVLASASYDNTVNLYDVDANEEWSRVDTLLGHSSTVWSLSFDRNSRIVTCSDDRSIKFWKKSSTGDQYECFQTLADLHDRTIFDVDWCSLSGLVATASGDNSVRILYEKDPDCFEVHDSVLDAHEDTVNCVKWNPVKKGQFLTCSDDESIKLWQIDV